MPRGEHLYSTGVQVFNLQRLAVLTASLAASPLYPSVIWEAMRDKVHQPQREGLVSSACTFCTSLWREPLLARMVASDNGRPVLTPSWCLTDSWIVAHLEHDDTVNTSRSPRHLLVRCRSHHPRPRVQGGRVARRRWHSFNGRVRHYARLDIGPAGQKIAGRSMEIAPMSKPGVDLSQPPSRTAPSIGCERRISSVSAVRRGSIAPGSPAVTGGGD